MIVLSMALLGATSCGYKQPVGEMCGNTGAASFVIPKSEIYLWSSDSSGGRVGGVVGNMTGAVLMLRWPDMVPRSKDNIREFNETYMKSLGPTPWISVLMRRPRTPRYPGYIAEELARELQYGDIAGGSVTYLDDAYGMEHAIYQSSQSATNNLYLDMWFYWSPSGRDAVGGHYIKCQNGMPVRPPEKLRLCEDNFYMDEINMEIVIGYRDNMLGNWSEIQRSVRAHLLSKIKECPAGDLK